MQEIIEFIFPRRLHRLAYFLRGCLVEALMYSACLFGVMQRPGLWLGSLAILVIYDVCFVLLPRMRDVELSGWWLLLLFVPLLNIWLGLVLLLRPPSFGSKGAAVPDPFQADAEGRI